MRQKQQKKEEKSLDFKIEGGHKLKGTMPIKKSKNAAVSLLCASLLNKGKTTLKKMPRIEEVFRIIEVLQSMGVKVEWKNEDLILNPKKIDPKKINRSSAERTRSVIMMIGPLIHHFKNFSLPYAGGCKLGERKYRDT
jgi:UDP-N-acetylglucosamine 1-carboxyvinyltransferase